ncbi:hypothetical protein ACSDIA_003377 [Cronobacter turicensis]|nr:hypothetical protein [Cronobacter turicensis]
MHTAKETVTLFMLVKANRRWLDASALSPPILRPYSTNTRAR